MYENDVITPGAYLKYLRRLKLMISPTGRGIRVDVKGDGHYGTGRGNREHRGIDFLCERGDPIYMPIDSGRWVRNVIAYTNSIYRGVVIEGKHKGERMFVKLLYMEPQMLSNITYHKGDIIGEAQAISERYGDGMKDHVHMEVYGRYDFQSDIDQEGFDD